MKSFGARLKRERERRKISLDDISLATKIGHRFLVALEEDHFDQLPGGVFNKGFVRAYARHLGLDEAQTIADFVAASEPSLPESQPLDAPVLAAMAVRVPEAVARKRSDRDGLPWGVFAIVLLVAAVGFALWGFHAREKPAATPAPKALSGLAVKPAAPGTATPASQAAPPESAPHVSETSAPAVGIAETTGKTGGFSVLIKAREDAWVAITADGKQTVQDTLTASAEKSVEAQNQVIVKTGNVGALDISFNGKKLPPQGDFNQVKTLTFDSNGLRP